MMSWEEYIKANISEFREGYENFPKEQRKLVEKDESFFLQTLNKPCQVVVIDFGEPHPICFIILHNKERPDMEIATLENVTLKDFSQETLKKVEMLKILSDSEIREIANAIEVVTPSITSDRWEVSAKPFEKSYMVWFSKDPRIEQPFKMNFSDFMFLTTETNTSSAYNRKRIEETVEDIKKDASTIGEANIRTRIIEKTEKLESQVNQLDKQHRKLRDEVVGVRRLVGTRTFGEWKTLLSEIDKMNTRIDAFSDIKEAYDKVLAQQNEFMKQQAEVMKQQSSFIKWIKYATILFPIAVISVPVIEIISIWIRHSLGVP